ncbi:importin alpha [Pelomyxa schiedti]|nr:importin alpha [Pelomyxa schiedti]
MSASATPTEGTQTTSSTHRDAVKAHGVDPDDVRKKREEFVVTVRKNKREETVNKRRNIVARSSAPAAFSSIKEMANACRSPNYEMCLLGATEIRKVLSVESNAPIDELIATGILPTITKFLTMMDHPKLQLEAAWILTNVASGTSANIEEVIKSGALPVLISSLSMGGPDLRVQTIWALGNIAGDNNEHRNAVVYMGIMQPLLRILTVDINLPILIKNSTWTLSNIFRHKNPAPEFDMVKGAIALLPSLLVYPDPDVQVDALWCTVYCSDCGEEFLDSVIKAGVFPHVANFARTGKINLQIPAFRIFGNAVSGNHAQTNAAIEAGAIKLFMGLLESEKKFQQKEACWALSNICAGTSGQLAELFKHGAIAALCDKFTTADFEIKKECCWAICNAITSSSPEQVAILLRCNILANMAQLLDANDIKLVAAILDSLKAILQTGEGEKPNPLIVKLEDADVPEKLEHILGSHPSEFVAEKARSLMDNFFLPASEEQAVDPTPTTTTQIPFRFAPPSPAQFSFP